MSRLVGSIILTALVSLTCLAQGGGAEAEFEKNKSRYRMEKFSEGEDATSGFDYLIYKKGNEIVKIREIWSSSAASKHRAEDYFFTDGRLISYVRYDFAGRFYKTARNGGKFPLTEVERLTFSDGKLSFWSENRKQVTPDDNRKLEKEKETLEKASDLLDAYRRFKTEN